MTVFVQDETIFTLILALVDIYIYNFLEDNLFDCFAAEPSQSTEEMELEDVPIVIPQFANIYKDTEHVGVEYIDEIYGYLRSIEVCKNFSLVLCFTLVCSFKS